MSFYQQLTEIGQRFIARPTLFKWGFNLSPMYRTSTARILDVSDDLMTVTIRLPIRFRNRNYVGSIFGGSMFAAVDPIPMVQLINLLPQDYVVWDKSAEILFRAPAREDLYADFAYSAEEIASLRKRVDADGEYEFVKVTRLMDRQRQKTFCEVRKTVYMATKAHYKAKRSARTQQDMKPS